MFVFYNILFILSPLINIIFKTLHFQFKFYFLTTRISLKQITLEWLPNILALVTNLINKHKTQNKGTK